ncbi:MAG: helix-turn-helix domain-containing protein [Ruminococcus flavefaciens]|nr:helix-turn-helix domain-containing protein [Ruminococcus flavefaciens]
MANLTSFKDVVNDRFYNLIFQALEAHVEDDPGSLGCRTNLVQDPTEARLDDMDIKLLDITGTVSNELKFDVVVGAEIEIKERHRSDVESDMAGQWFRVACSCDISNGIKNFRIHGMTIYSRNQNRQPGQLSDYLVPIIHKTDLDSVADSFLRQYYPEALEAPTSIDIAKLTERMGLTVRQEHLTKTGSLFGQVFFADSIVPCYDPQAEDYKKVPVEEGTILVDPNVFFMYTFGTYRSTVVHECVHWALHRRFFELEKLYNPEAKSIKCQVQEGRQEERKRTPLEWMEWQANSITPRILMPAAQTNAKMKELLPAIIAQSNGASDADILERLIIALADFFDVSKQMAKIRMIDLGYTEAIGVLNYKPTGYIQSYVTKGPGKDLTYDVEPADIAVSFAFNEGFRKMMESGRYVYVDHHLCVNDPKYIDTRYGLAFMTDYARAHMSECCLTFKVTRRKRKDYGATYYTECGLFRQALEEDEVEASYLHNAFNQKVDDAASKSQDFQATVKTVNGLLRILPSTFSGTLDEHMKRLHLTNEALADRCLINEDMIRRYRNETREPKLPTVVALCVGLQLPAQLGMDLIAKAGFAFKPTEEHTAYWTIVATMTQNSIYECNEMLRSMNIRELAKEQ